MFVFFGLNGFLQFLPAASLGGNADAFFGAMSSSHFIFLPSGVQLVAGILLLADLYVPLALVLLAAVLANILAFHLAMNPAGIGLGLFATLLWFVVALPLRAHFAPLFARKVRSSAP